MIKGMTGSSMKAHHPLYWDEESQEEFFGNHNIDKDGGLGDHTYLRKLFKPYRWGLALYHLVLLCGNIWFLTGYNIWETSGQAFVIPVAESPHLTMYFSNTVIGAITGYHVNSCYIVSIVEYILFVYYILAISYQCLRMNNSIGKMRSCWSSPQHYEEPDLDFERWKSISIILWRLIPGLSSDSALRCLHYVCPSIVLPAFFSDLKNLREDLTDMQAGRKNVVRHLWEIMKFSTLTMLALLAGLEAFTVKCVEASYRMGQLSGGERWLPALIIIVPLMNQMLGIIRVSAFAENRLLLFVFGGEDSVWEERERKACRRWKARLAYKTWKVAQEDDRKKFSLLWFFSVVFTYTDVDFQFLLLSKSKWHTVTAKAVAGSGKIRDSE